MALSYVCIYSGHYIQWSLNTAMCKLLMPQVAKRRGKGAGTPLTCRSLLINIHFTAYGSCRLYLILTQYQFQYITSNMAWMRVLFPRPPMQVRPANERRSICSNRTDKYSIKAVNRHELCMNIYSQLVSELDPVFWYCCYATYTISFLTRHQLVAGCAFCHSS